MITFWIIYMMILYTFAKHHMQNDIDIEPFVLNYGPQSYNIYGYKPAESTNNGPYPLHMWVTGTGDPANDNHATIYTSYMSKSGNGFISASIEYNNGPYPLSCGGSNGFLAKSESIFNITNPSSAIYVLCNSAVSGLDIDCNKGVVVNGMSQGAQIVSLSALYAGSFITAILEMGGGNQLQSQPWPVFECLNFDNLNIAQNRIRSMIGENDAVFCGGANNNGCRIAMQAITGLSCPMAQPNCVDNIQTDGNGWYIVQAVETYSGTAEHCYAWGQGDCDSDEFDENYYNGCQLNCKWSLESDFAWLVFNVYPYIKNNKINITQITKLQ
eukprot:164733_1